MVKKTVKKDKTKKTEEKQIPAKRYIYAIGRRKEAHAQIKLYDGTGKILINNRELSNYFSSPELQQKVFYPLELAGEKNKCDVAVKVEGGGKNGQTEAVAHGIARALKLKNKDYRVPLKKAGLLKRDPRAKERKKYGLKGARRAPQWQKR
jgi:small subunit ribosomal protein S9